MELIMRVLFGALFLLSALSVIVQSAEEKKLNHIRVPPLKKGNTIKLPVSGATIINPPPFIPSKTIINPPPFIPSKVNYSKFPPFNPPKNPPFNPPPVNHPKFPPFNPHPNPPFNPPPVNPPKYPPFNPPPVVPPKYPPFNPPPVNPPSHPPPVYPPFHPPPVNPPFNPPPVNPPFHPPPVNPPFYPPPVIPPFHPPPVNPPYVPPPVNPPYVPPPVIPPFHPPPVNPHHPLPNPVPPPVNPFPIPPLPNPIDPVNPPHPPHPPHPPPPPPTCNVCDTLDAGFGKINDSFSEVGNLLVNLIDEAESCVPKGSTDVIVRKGPIATCPEGSIVFQCRCNGPCSGPILTDDGRSCTSVYIEEEEPEFARTGDLVTVIAYCAYNFNSKFSIETQPNSDADTIACPAQSKVVSCFGSLNAKEEIETTIDVDKNECSVSDAADCEDDTCLFFAVCKKD